MVSLLKNIYSGKSGHNVCDNILCTAMNLVINRQLTVGTNIYIYIYIYI